MAEFLQPDDHDAVVARLVKALRDGRLVVVPGDGVYTVLVDAFQTFATQQLFTAKQRGPEEPLSLLIRNPRQVIGLAREVPETAERLMAAFWPGRVSLILPAQPDMPWELGQLNGAVGLRMPSDELTLAVAAEIGPLACSAANRRGEAFPTTVAEAHVQLGETVAVYVDGGKRDSVGSTVVDCTGTQVSVLREGAVPATDVKRVAEGALGWGERPQAETTTETAAVDEPSSVNPAEENETG